MEYFKKVVDGEILSLHERRAFIAEVAKKLPFLALLGKDLDTAFDYAKEYQEQLFDYPEGILFEVLASLREELRERLGKVVPGISPVLYYSNLVWEMLYALLCYFCHGEEFWEKNVLPRMIELEPQHRIRDEMGIASELVSAYYIKRDQFITAAHEECEARSVQKELGSAPANESEDAENIKLREKIKQLEDLLNQKDTIIAEKDARIAELESQHTHPHLSFIQTEGKNPDQIRWAYEDIKKAIVGPAEMAECLHNLQVQGMLKNQERYGKLKKIKKIHEELQKTYGFEWTYDALRRALNRITTKK